MLVADAPSVTDWMQGWGSILSLVVSTGALVFTGWLLRHEIRVRREEKADAAAAQARLIVAQISDWGGDGKDAHMYGPITRVQSTLKNYSNAPIFDLTVTVDGRWNSHTFGVAIENDDRHWVTCHPPLTTDWGTIFDPREIEVKIEFTDAAGLRWRRTMGEPPERVLFEPGRSQRKLWLRFLRVRGQLAEQLDGPVPDWFSATTKPSPVAAKPVPDADQDDEQSPAESRPSGE